MPSVTHTGFVLLPRVFYMEGYMLLTPTAALPGHDCNFVKNVGLLEHCLRCMGHGARVGVSPSLPEVLFYVCSAFNALDLCRCSVCRP